MIPQSRQLHLRLFKCLMIRHHSCPSAAIFAQAITRAVQDFGSSSIETLIVFFEARIRASSLVSTAVALTPSGETVTTK